MATQIEIWCSFASLADGAFFLAATVADTEPAYSYVGPLATGKLAFFRARRHNTTYDLYSDWSPIITLSGGYPQGANMFPPNTTQSSISSLIGIGVEAIRGQAVKSVRLMERVDGTMVAEHELLDREAIHNHPGVAGFVRGPSSVGGSLTLEATPESLSEVLCALAGAPVTTDVAPPVAPGAPTVVVEGAAGAVNYSYTIVAGNAQGDSAASGATAITTGNAALTDDNYNAISWLPVQGALYYKVLRGGALVATVYGLTYNDQAMATSVYAAPASGTGKKQLWNTGLNQLTVTLNELQGNVYQATAGCIAKTLALGFDKSQKTPLRAKVDFVGLWQNRGLTASQCGLDTAGFDPLGAIGVAPTTVTMIGGVIASVQKADYSIDRADDEKQILSGYTGAHGHYLKGGKHTCKQTLYFDTDAEMQAFFGQAATTGVYGLASNIFYYPIETVSTLPVNGSGIINQVGLWFPYAAFKKVGLAIKGKDAIMQDIEITPAIDPVTGFDVAIYVVNSQSNAAIVTPGTLMTGVDAGLMFPYSN